jgi:hypothetical protein
MAQGMVAGTLQLEALYREMEKVATQTRRSLSFRELE